MTIVNYVIQPGTTMKISDYLNAAETYCLGIGGYTNPRASAITSLAACIRFNTLRINYRCGTVSR